MKHIYDSFIFKRMAEGRIFFVNARMPFEFFVDCFQVENPFFLVSQLEDGRVAITPNTMFISLDALQAGHGPRDLLPSEYEYVTMKKGFHPLIITAHPVKNVDDWLRKFERWVRPFATQSLAELVNSHYEFLPLQFERKAQAPIAEPITS